jgi:ATP-dependent DNA ligase
VLPAAPALARPDALPRAAGWSFEVKWDGIRALLSTENGLRIKSRRGWDMTDRLPELAELPAGLVLDGELVAFQGSVPHWPLVCDRVLHRRSVPIVYQLFDILAVEGHSVMSNTYAQRRALLEGLDLNGPCWQTPDRFDDGEALLSSVCQLGLEGVIAKRTNGPYRPGERDWIKVKNRGYWRFGDEHASVRRTPASRST